MLNISSFQELRKIDMRALNSSTIKTKQRQLLSTKNIFKGNKNIIYKYYCIIFMPYDMTF